jgi:hypothetical protein
MSGCLSTTVFKVLLWFNDENSLRRWYATGNELANDHTNHHFICLVDQRLPGTSSLPSTVTSRCRKLSSSNPHPLLSTAPLACIARRSALNMASPIQLSHGVGLYSIVVVVVVGGWLRNLGASRAPCQKKRCWSEGESLVSRGTAERGA